MIKEEKLDINIKNIKKNISYVLGEALHKKIILSDILKAFYFLSPKMLETNSINLFVDTEGFFYSLDKETNNLNPLIINDIHICWDLEKDNLIYQKDNMLLFLRLFFCWMK